METLQSRRTFLKTAGIAVGSTLFSGNIQAAFSQNQKVKIGQIGTGHAHAYKSSTLRELTDCFEFIGIAEDDPGRRKEAEKQKIYQGLRWMSSDELLARTDVQAIALEEEEHISLPVALRCIRAGKHIHYDKPAGESLAGFRQLLDEAKAKNLTVQMGYMLRNNPAVQFCMKAVKDGLLGKIFDVDASMSRYDGESARKRISTFTGGSFFLLGCHLIDVAVSLLGEPEKIHPFMKQSRADGCLDNGMAVFEYPNGSIATLRASVAEAEGNQRRHLTILGEKGSIIVQPLEAKKEISGVVQLALEKDTDGFKKGLQTIDMPPMKDRYDDQWREFAAIVNGTMANPYSYEHEYTVQKCLLKACSLE